MVRFDWYRQKVQKTLQTEKFLLKARLTKKLLLVESLHLHNILYTSYFDLLITWMIHTYRPVMLFVALSI